jgi:hypothetical protein
MLSKSWFDAVMGGEALMGFGAWSGPGGDVRQANKIAQLRCDTLVAP